MRKLCVLFSLLLWAAVLTAQAPQAFTFQKVVRSSDGHLVTNAAVGVRVTIQKTNNNQTVFMENHSVSTNVNGLMTLVVGRGQTSAWAFSDINWEDNLSLKVEIDPNGGSNYTITYLEPLSSVPYAIYANEIQEGVFSGDYNDLYNQPTIPVVPNNVSAFTNDPPYIVEVPTLANQVAVAAQDSLVQRLESIQNQVMQQEALVDSLSVAMDSIVNGGFLCGIHKVVDFDGNVYNTVQIDKQCWMRENLRVRHFSDGTEIPWGSNVKDGNPYCYHPMPANQPGYSLEVGGLHYNWPAAMHGNSSSNASPSGVQGACPTGWHVPSMAEWQKMLNFVQSNPEYACTGSPASVARALSNYSATWEASADSCTPGNASGIKNQTLFSVVPTGLTYITVTLQLVNNYKRTWAKFWTSSGDPSQPRNVHLSYNSAYVETTGPNTMTFPYSAMPVRCVRDEAVLHSVRQILPVVTTSRAYNMTDSTFLAGGNLISDGNSLVTSRGICWSTQPNPTVNGPHVDGGPGTMGSFRVMPSGLNMHTVYYYRAYATNAVGTAYGEEYSVATTWVQVDSLTCPGHPTVTDIDGNIYTTVKVGEQCWMRENLRVTHFPNGDSIPMCTDWNLRSDTLPICYPPAKDVTKIPAYGILYNWNAAINGEGPSNTVPSGVRGICPDGWHIPSNDEQYQLKAYVTALDQYRCTIPPSHVWYVSPVLASNFGWESCSTGCTPGYNLAENNATGFSICPAGSIIGNVSYSFIGGYYGFGTFGGIMSSSLLYSDHYDKYYTYALGLRHNENWISGADLFYRKDAVSVRCLQDYEAAPSAGSSCQLPTVITGEVAGLTASSAAIGGMVVNIGGCDVTEWGVCWNTSQYPTTNDYLVVNHGDSTDFTCQLTELQPETEYFVRAYAVNDEGIAYGEERHFTTTDSVIPSIGVPSVTTYPVTDITLTSAVSGGIVTSDGGAYVTEYGLCWGFNPNPTVENFHVALGAGTETFSYTLENLYMSLPYHVRAYAINSEGIGYGQDVAFQTATPDPLPFNQICPGTSVVFDYDSNVYNTVRIGNQCWLRENLRTTHLNDGTEIPLVTWSSSTPARYSPGGTSNNVPDYGYLYNWSAVMGGASASPANPSGVQGICPPNWHVPSVAEYQQLNDYVGTQASCRCNGYSQNVAVALSDYPPAYWNYTENYDICTAYGSYYHGYVGKSIQYNRTGFSARAAGLYQGDYVNMMASAEYWTTTMANNGNPMAMVLQFTSPEMLVSNSIPVQYGISVRCVRNLPVTCLPTVYTTTVKYITTNSAQSGGEVTHDGGGTVTESGLVWGTSPAPTLADNFLISGVLSGSFTDVLNGLQPSTTYYVRAYVIRSTDTVYGNEISFYTNEEDSGDDGFPCMGAPTVTDYDGNTYNTIQLGEQCWMRENLRTTHFSDGTEIVLTTNQFSDEIPYRYYPNNNSIYVTEYGYLYNWRAVYVTYDTNTNSVPSGVQGLCPTGWHVPSNAEWNNLKVYLASRTNYSCDQVSEQMGKAMASSIGWNLADGECYVGEYQMANNASGYNAYPAGYILQPPADPIFPRNFGVSAVFWSTTNNSSQYKRNWMVSSASSTFSNTITKKTTGASLRCLKD